LADIEPIIVIVINPNYQLTLDLIQRLYAALRIQALLRIYNPKALSIQRVSYAKTHLAARLGH
jgi:hypothetical protein